jgi:hypothetical protein
MLASVNYLHFGNALDGDIAPGVLPERGAYSKRDLMSRLASCEDSLLVLLRGYGGKHSKKIDVEEFRLDLSKSLAHRRFFRSLGCRGFSYKLDDEIDFPEPLKESATLRVALMPDELLFYPSRVKQYLRRVNNNHYFCDGYPAIAFALGLRASDAWFVFVMQSDLALRKPAYIREHFRGWRKVLFANILRMAAGKAAMVYLCRSEDVLRACNKDFPTPRGVPMAWTKIYDETASFFGMKLVQLAEPVDTQVFPRQPPITTDCFYALSITPSVEVKVKTLFGDEQP